MSEKPSLTDLFTTDEIAKAHTIWRTLTPQEFVATARASIVQPALERINTQTRQENDPTFLAHVLMRFVTH